MPILSIERPDATEDNAGSGGPYMYFRVTLSEPSSDEISVQYIASSGTAVEADFSYYADLRTAVLTIPANETEALIAVRVQGDTLDERDESYWVKLFNPVGAELSGDATSLLAVGVVRDDDGTGADISMFVSSPDIVEDDDGSHSAVFEVHLSRAYDTDLTFEYSTANGTAIGDEDYVPVSGTITFLAGQTSASVEVDVLGDTLQEATESFSLVVKPTSPISNGTLGSTGVATILDDDSRAGDLPVINIKRVDATEDDKGSGGPYLYFEVTLSEASDEEITFDYRAFAGTATEDDFSYYAPLQKATLTIPANTTKLLIPVRVQGDTIDDVDESMWMELTNPKGAELAGGESRLTAIGIVRDNDLSGANLALFVSSPTLTEGSDGTKSAVFEVHLSQPNDEDLTFDYQTADGTAKAGSDYTAASGEITILAGQISTAVTITISGDTEIENSEYFSLVVTPTADIKSPADAHVGKATILNDDTIHQIIEGGDDIDKLFGKGGNDELYGLANNDILDGGKGIDKLFGGDGNDTLIGGNGRDELYGDAGGDTFVFTKTAESTVAIGGRDTIFDFSRKDGDHLDLDAIDAHAKLRQNQDFDFIGSKAFTGRGAEVRFEKSDGDTFVYADTNGDRKADFAIQLEGSMNLKAGDFLL